ncbi:MAG: radical SAM protein [Ignisphaera sp.]
MSRITELYEKKLRIIERLKSLIGEDGARKASLDSHSKRVPRPCGLTIHTGVGCDYACAYCYIYDMGFPGRVRPYPLKPLEMAYAIASNPYVLPEKSLLAYGSVTEPFHPITKNLALEYIENVSKWLKPLSQVSTKSFIDDGLAKRLSIAEPNISILLSIATLDKSKELEPRAPDPIKRLEGASIAIKNGLNVTLFVRPIIPSVTDREGEKILAKALDYGIRDVVFGSLRVTERILKSLEARGIDIDAILARIPRAFRGRGDQVTIKESDIKKRLVSTARDMGYRVYPSACSANIASHGQFCNMCSLGPCGDPSRKEKISESDIGDYLEFRGVKRFDIQFDEKGVLMKICEDSRGISKEIAWHISIATRLRVSLKSVKC